MQETKCKQPCGYKNQEIRSKSTHGAAMGSPNVGPQERPKGEYIQNRIIQPLVDPGFRPGLDCGAPSGLEGMRSLPKVEMTKAMAVSR